MCDMTPAKLSQALLARNFDPEMGLGFRVIERTREFISAIFIERIVTQEKIIDPYGSITELETIRYASIKFHLHFRNSDEFNYLLEVCNPPRSIRSMISNLSDTLSGITIGELNFPLIEIYSKVRNEFPRARIIKLKAFNISISNHSDMRIEVNSSVDAYIDFKKFFNGNESKLEKIKIENLFSNPRNSLEIGTSGLISFDDESEDYVRALVLETHLSSQIFKENDTLLQNAVKSHTDSS